MKRGDLPIYDHTDQGIRLIEEERRRIARDLHDGPTQVLTNVSMRLELIERMIENNPTVAQKELFRSNGQIVAAISQIRRLLFDLRPVAVDEIGLVKATMDLAGQFQRDNKLPVEVQAQEEVGKLLSPAKQVSIYRLLQEILNNIKKHADASEVKISFDVAGDDIIICVKDNGKGFDPTHIPAGHYGIIGMKERADYSGGRLDIESVIGEGSLFKITIPVSNITKAAK